MSLDAPSRSANEVNLDASIVTASKVPEPWSLEKALAVSSIGKPAEGSSSPVPFFHVLERLKTTKRAGWQRFSIYGGESISDHMYRMAMMTMSAPPSITSRLDMNKCMKMCLIHDVAESLVGDITPIDGISKPEKNRREASVTDYFAKTLLGNVPGTSGEDIGAIWQEYEDHKTPESQFVADLDKVELLLQMVEYETRGDGKVDLAEFTYVATKVNLPETKAWVREILNERKEFWSKKGLVPATDQFLSDQTKKALAEYYAENA